MKSILFPAALATTLVMLAAPVRAQGSELPGARPLPAPAQLQSGNRGRRLGDEMECLVEPSLVVNLGSPVEGTLSEVLVERGSDVRQGQAVARLHAAVETANLNLRRAQLEYGERKLQRNEDLFKKELVSASEKDELSTQVRLAELEVRQAEAIVNLRTITSPVTGVVVERYLAPGDRVAQDKIMRIAQIDPLHVEAVVSVELFGRIRVGSSADVRLDPLITGVQKAVVTVVDRVVDPASGTFAVRLRLPNPSGRIPAGIRCMVRFGR